MVSRVYTPLVSGFTRPQQAGGQRGPAGLTGEDEKRAFHAPPTPERRETTAATADNNEMRRPSAGLQAVQVDRFQKIPLDAVLNDFKSTMNALGADDQTRAEVGAYLRVVSLQANKEQPEVPFIKHTLRTAAGTLDQFISKALGQPSQVVKEWVDALLLQDIDYHTDQSPEDPASGTAPSANHLSDMALPEAASPKLEKARLKALIAAAKAEHQSGDPVSADGKLDETLSLLQNVGRPDLEGKVWHLRARFQEKTGAWQQAVSSYDTAAGKFSAASLPDKQANSLHAMASLFEDRGQLEQAQGAYRQVVALDAQTGDPKLLLRSLNDLGRLELRQGLPDQAAQTLEQARQTLQTGDFPALTQSDVLSNLGAAYRARRDFPQAEETYRQALQAAKTGRDRSRYATTLQQLAALYVEANQPAQAMKALQRLESLSKA